eukprot:m.207595 g.207595  ORF g.207595 m.207595 type:complete len:245 (-) comp18523_c0_seq7:1088-1822(-)
MACQVAQEGELIIPARFEAKLPDTQPLTNPTVSEADSVQQVVSRATALGMRVSCAALSNVSPSVSGLAVWFLKNGRGPPQERRTTGGQQSDKRKEMEGKVGENRGCFSSPVPANAASNLRTPRICWQRNHCSSTTAPAVDPSQLERGDRRIQESHHPPCVQSKECAGRRIVSFACDCQCVESSSNKLLLLAALAVRFSLMLVALAVTLLVVGFCLRPHHFKNAQPTLGTEQVLSNHRCQQRLSS